MGVRKMTNRPERHELLTVPVGSRKVVVQREGKLENASQFTIEREDHTIGNMLRMQLLRDPKVLFAGYKVPHPLDYKIHVKVQTTADSKPTQAMQGAITDLQEELNMFEERFRQEVNRKKNPDQQE